MRICDVCKAKEAIYTNYLLRASLCPDCLMSSVKRRAWSVLRRELRQQDKIMVAHSGGKDSSLALLLTKGFSDEARDFGLRVVSVTIDEGTLYRRASVELARKLAERLGVRQVTVQMNEVLGFSIEELRSVIPRNWKRNACTYCGVLRRQLINAVAREMGATVVVTGHNLDDLIQTSLMNLVRGDLNALTKAMRHERRYEEGLVPRVRPLKYVYEREVASLVVALGIPAHLGKCPLAQGMRIGIRREIDFIEELEPGAKLRALSFFENTLSKLEVSVSIGECSICGEPTTLDVCKACQFRGEVSSLMGLKEGLRIDLDSIRRAVGSAFRS
ncbi:MAG: TIGR00269 family protein [Candidatus Korarchaeum sp.]|nr:TIGR00269 family protein [Candidatus Korarchaeum sp.]MDW8034908.1 TIGR00269 family protein [Candidatus Korarchaeum sp.]